MRPAPPALRGAVYAVTADGSGDLSMGLVSLELEAAELSEGEIVGPWVRVGNRCVLVDATGGKLAGVPMPPISAPDGVLNFAPSGGGVRTRENRLAVGRYNHQVAEATRFGMVNSYHHFHRAAVYCNRLLADLGAPPLPRLRVVVAAHSGSRLPGFGSGDGDFRRGRLRPFSGGHYRLSGLTTVVPEPYPVDPLGEVHLGPGWSRGRFPGHDSYLQNAAHNPATIYHEFGHHLGRHTADFRLNTERPPDQQRNGKTAVEEGICDYFTAALLGSGRPYGSYRPSRGERRDPGNMIRRPVPEDADAHAAGASWSAAFWQVRAGLLADGLIGTASDHDACLIAAMLEAGAAPAATGRERRGERRAERAAGSLMAGVYLATLHSRIGKHGVRLATLAFERNGIPVGGSAGQSGSRC